MKTDSSEKVKGKTLKKPKLVKNSEKKKIQLNASNTGSERTNLTPKRRKCLAEMINKQSREIANLKQKMESLDSNPPTKMKKPYNGLINATEDDKAYCFSAINQQLQTQLEEFKTQLYTIELEKMKEESLDSCNTLDKDAIGKMAKFNAIRDMQNKLNLLHKKFFESRNKNTQLQSQLKLAQKCLQQEIGENFNLTTLASQAANSNWRGRAQEIMYLQQKLLMLKRRLKSYEQQSSKVLANSKRRKASFEKIPMSGDNAHITPLSRIDRKVLSEKFSKRLTGGIDLSTNSSSPTRLSKIDRKDKPIKRMTLEKLGAGGDCSFDFLKDIEKSSSCSDNIITKVNKMRVGFQTKVTELEAQINELKSKLDEKTNRMILLKKHNSLLKEQLNGDKGMYPRHSVPNYSAQLASQKKYSTMSAQQLEIELFKMQNRLNETRRLRNEDLKTNAKVLGKLQKLEAEVSNKENKINKLNETIQGLEADLKAISGGFLFSCRELHKEEFIGVLNALETEKKDLLEYNKTLNHRVKKERQENELLIKQLGEHKIEALHLETKIGEMAKALAQQQKQYEDSTEKSQTTTGNNINKLNGRPQPMNRLHEHSLQMKINQLVQELEIKCQTINKMEKKIKFLNEEKDKDCRNFESVVENSKSMLLETILGLRRNCNAVSTSSNNSLVRTSSSFE